MKLGLIPLVLFLGGCSSLPSLWSSSPHVDQVREQLAHEAALTPGASACRLVPLGFAEQHQVRGKVLRLQNSDVQIQLDADSDPILIDGVLRKGNDAFSTPTAQWTPCP